MRSYLWDTGKEMSIWRTWVFRTKRAVSRPFAHSASVSDGGGIGNSFDASGRRGLGETGGGRRREWFGVASRWWAFDCER